MTSECKDFLEERMDPDFGLLNKLRARNALSKKDMDEIKTQQTYRNKNLMIIDHIILNEKFEELIGALKDAQQSHIANYLIANGEYRVEFGEDWPLGDKEVSILDANEERLVDLLDTGELLPRLYSVKIINMRQREFISSKQTNYEKNEELLKILRRGSLSSYWLTIKCLRSSNQNHIADLFENGGVLVQIDATLAPVGANVDEAEQQLATEITRLLGDRSLTASNRILELVQLGLVAAKKGHSVELYFYCLGSREVDNLQDMCTNGDLKDIIEMVFNRVLAATGNIRVKIVRIARCFNRDRSFRSVGVETDDDLERKQKLETVHRHSQMNVLPLELVDLILQKSYLCFVICERKSEGQNSFSKMATVDCCWFERLRKRNLKRKIWRRLTAFYRYGDKFAIYRNNHSFFAENMQPNAVLIRRLRAADCLTDIQARLLSRGKLRTDKAKRNKLEVKADLLHIVRSFKADRKFADFIVCLEQSNQNVVAKFARSGGVSIKLTIVTSKWRNRQQLAKQFVQGLNDLLDMKKIWPAELDLYKLMCQLINDRVEILNCFPDRQVVAWIWGRSQAAFDHLRSFDEQHDLATLFSCQAKTVQAAIQPHDIGIDVYQFKKEFVLLSTACNCIGSLEVRDKEFVVGVTKLRTEIYVLCRSIAFTTVIRVFHDTDPFPLQEKIELKTVKFPKDIVSSEKSTCLYVIDTWNQCIWKFITESGNKCNPTKWLSIGIDWSPLLSVSRDDGLLILRGCGPLSRLEIYGSDASLHLSIQLPAEIQFPQHAVETSTGNFVVCFEWADDEKKGGTTLKGAIWEVTRNGKMFIRRFIQEELITPRYLLIDSQDRLLVADELSYRVILLYSNFRWNGMIIGSNRYLPLRMRYDEAKEQLIVAYELKGLCPRIYDFK